MGGVGVVGSSEILVMCRASWMTSCTVGIPRSLWIMSLVTYHVVSTVALNTLRTGLLNCLNALSRGLNFRHRASCIQGQAFRYSPENALYIINQQIYFII